MSQNDELSPSLAPPPELSLTQLESNQQKKVHLVTWSQANDSLLPDRANPRSSFGNLVTELFANTGNQVQHWACSREAHRLEGHHYHLSMQFLKRVRWLSVSRQLNKRGINANFQSFHSGYKDAFEYVTKEDKDFVKSPQHPRLIPRYCSKAMRPPKRSLEYPDDPAELLIDGFQQDSQDAQEFSQQPTSSRTSENQSSHPVQAKVRKLSNVEVGKIIIEQNIHTDLELCALAKTTSNNQQPELAHWLMNHSNEKARNDVIKTAWKMHSAEEAIVQNNIPRLDKLEQHLQEPHASDLETGLECNGRWLVAALQILSNNNISIESWQEDVKNCLRLGRTKRNNLYLLGERNCGKTFLLQPLTLIYTTFCSPASGTFNWVGAETSELVYLNDFRYPAVDNGGDKILQWRDFLNLLDGNTLAIAAPKTHYAQDIQWTARQPIVGSGPYRIKYVHKGIEDRTETAMMDTRWKYISLTKSIPDEHIDNTLIPCTRCFAQLILNDMDMVDEF